MIVTFCGHSQITNPETVSAWLHTVIHHLILQGADTFYLGGRGMFDQLAASVLRQQQKTYPQIRMILVLAYLRPGQNSDGYDGTLYPPLESVPLRYAIVKRNQWMARTADILVACVLYDWGGAASMLRYAQQTGKKIIRYPLADS